MKTISILLCLLFVPYAAVANTKHSLQVTASAYTSHKNQTQGNPLIAAWGNRLHPGVKSIAVSRDLLRKGLKNGTKVTIDGLKGTYVVRDKMHRKWRNKIDIYMGYNLHRARQWGRRKVVIRWS